MTTGQDPASAGLSVPPYADGSLADVLVSVAASLGVPGYRDVLGLGASTQAVVLLVDGLGWDLLGRHADAAPFLAGLMRGGRWLTAGFPTTTVTSLASLGTGLAPGAHGLVGYTFHLPEQGRVINALRWDTGVVPEQAQPHPTVLEDASADEVHVAHVGPRAFAGSGLTRAALRGAVYPGAETLGETVETTAQLLDAGGRGLAYVYHGDLDNVGHLRGCGSEGWRAQLAHVDLLASQLAALLPTGAVLHVTADHGMVDVPEGSRVDVDRVPELLDGVRELGGEPRARHVYAEAGAERDVLEAWRERLDGQAWVLARDEAVASGWFGPAVSSGTLARIGDVVTASTSDHAIVASQTQPLESSLVGYHGSLTAAELRVPFLSVRA